MATQLDATNGPFAPAAATAGDGTMRTLRVHYARRDGEYEGWGLHLWGGATAATGWDAPQLFTGRDDFGVYVDVRILDAERPLFFIVHKGGDKDGTHDRTFADLRSTAAVWLKQGRKEVWRARPPDRAELLHAELTSATEIVASIDPPIGARADAAGGPTYAVLDEDGGRIDASVVAATATSASLRTATALDIARPHILELADGSEPRSRVPLFLAGELLDREFFYDGDDLGAHLAAPSERTSSVTFKVWSPPASAVRVVLFDRDGPERELGTFPLSRAGRGVWAATLTAAEVGQPLEGLYYQYEVTAHGATHRVLDPYAKSMAPFVAGGPAAPLVTGREAVGKGAIVAPRRSDPPGFRASPRPRLDDVTDFIGYELHVRDFTINPDSGVAPELRGTYRGFAAAARLGYLQELGVTHVQLLPLQSFYSIDELDRRFDDGSSRYANYAWGYDPHNYFTPSGWYSLDPRDPSTRLREVKEMVAALHAAGLGVTIDVVYNHIYDKVRLDHLAPGCYLRADATGAISTHSGAGPSLETRRKMVRKLIVDSLAYWVDEYRVDGFRFDIMGFIDLETMRAIRVALGPDVLLYGEGWEFTDLPAAEATTKTTLPQELDLAVFSDTSRDSFTGALAGKGFVQGLGRTNPKVRAGIIANLSHYDTDAPISTDPYDRYAHRPSETLNFLSIHDGYTLWDKLLLSEGGTDGHRARLARLALAMLMTSQGRVILHGGDEIGRTKPLAAVDRTRHRAHTSDVAHAPADLPGVLHFHENSYASADFTNMVRWGRRHREPFASLGAYCRDLIALRRRYGAFRMREGQQVRDRLQFLPPLVQQQPLPGPFRSFTALAELTLELVNGPRGARAFVTGEVFGKSAPSKNPTDNPFAVQFDENGRGRIRFTAAQIRDFDLKAWTQPQALQLKLVFTPGSWDPPPQSYSELGNNLVRPEAISATGIATIDLAHEDAVAGDPGPDEPPVIAYTIDAAADHGSPFDTFVVVYNGSNEPATVSAAVIADPRAWRVLLDGEGAYLEGRSPARGEIGRGSVTAAAKSAMVVARRRGC